MCYNHNCKKQAEKADVNNEAEGGKHNLSLQGHQWHQEGKLEGILSHHASTGEPSNAIRHSMRSLMLSGIVGIRVQMGVKSGLEKFGWKQGCVCWDLLSTVVDMHPLV